MIKSGHWVSDVICGRPLILGVFFTATSSPKQQERSFFDAEMNRQFGKKELLTAMSLDIIKKMPFYTIRRLAYWIWKTGKKICFEYLAVFQREKLVGAGKGQINRRLHVAGNELLHCPLIPDIFLVKGVTVREWWERGAFASLFFLIELLQKCNNLHRFYGQ